MAIVRWSDGSIGSIGQAILRSDKYFTDGEMTLLQNAREHTLEARGFASMTNVRWSDGSIRSIGQAIYNGRTNILPMVKYIACHVSYLENEASIFLVLHDCHYLRRKI